jgi:hypothetical protein
MATKRLIVSRNELRLATDESENNDDNQPVKFHICRWLFRKDELSPTACGKKNIKGQVWAYYGFIADNEHATCSECRSRITLRGEIQTDRMSGILKKA